MSAVFTTHKSTSFESFRDLYQKFQEEIKIQKDVFDQAVAKQRLDQERTRLRQERLTR